MGVRAIALAIRRFLRASEQAARAGRVPDREGVRRAREFLFAQLTPEQRSELERRRAFTVRGESGRLYRIGVGFVANIEALDDAGRTQYRLCACPRRLPTWGVMLAQKLMLEGREAEFLRLAVRHPATLKLSAELERAAP
jgi:hypothetical protein